MRGSESLADLSAFQQAFWVSRFRFHDEMHTFKITSLCLCHWQPLSQEAKCEKYPARGPVREKEQ